MEDHESQMGLYPGDKTFQFLHPIRNVCCYQSWQKRPMCIMKDAGNPQPMLMTQKEFFKNTNAWGPSSKTPQLWIWSRLDTSISACSPVESHGMGGCFQNVWSI